MEQNFTIFEGNYKGGLRYIIDRNILSKLEQEFYSAVEKASIAAIDLRGAIRITNKEA